MMSGWSELGNPLRETAVRPREVPCILVRNMTAELGSRLEASLQLLLSRAYRPLCARKAGETLHHLLCPLTLPFLDLYIYVVIELAKMFIQSVI